MKETHSLTRLILALALTFFIAGCKHHTQRDPLQQRIKYAGYKTLVAETHRRSMEARTNELQSVVSKDSCWPHGAWGDTMWSLVALYLNKRVDEANARLLKRAREYLSREESKAFAPGHGKDTPWAYFGLVDYVRILCLFHSRSPHFPGRLSAETEGAMKSALRRLVKSRSKVADASLENLRVTLGTENHDLTQRPAFYLIASVLKDDPEFKERKYEDGHTPAEHFTAYNRFFQGWPREKVKSGLWIETGSDTYQKYSWPALFNLHELSPDPVVRKRFGMLLDLAFIEEAQISVRGRRGGGRSRAGYGGNSFEYYKNLLYAPEGVPARSSHSKVIGTSKYQLPAAAILLRHIEFPAAMPFLITNRLPGELEEEGKSFSAKSSLNNYAWRTRHYLLGCTLQNPALSRMDAETGQPVLKYAGISRQKRWSGMLFDDPKARHPLLPAANHRTDDEPCAIFPIIEKTRGGRPQHSYWNFQHRNVMFVQRIAPQQPEHPMRMGSYSTGNIRIRFHGRRLTKVEVDGWIFASNGSAFAGVKFLDDDYEWDEAKETASPVGYERFKTSSRFLIHAGDIDTHRSFDQFRESVLRNPLKVETDTVEYRVMPERTRLEVFRYDADAHGRFRLPKVNGKTLNLKPSWKYSSPYLKARTGSDRFTVTVGPVEQVYDFAETTIQSR